jgi:hypothetical protein
MPEIAHSRSERVHECICLLSTVTLWRPEGIKSWLPGGGGMKYRIAMWATAGFLVACFWVLFAIATFPSSIERMRDLWALVGFTCPVAMAGRYYPISFYEVLAANAITYASVGLLVETVRKQLHQPN